MRVPFTWRPTGWFMIGWSAEIPPGGLKPTQYFGQHLVAYRTGAGDLHVLDDLEIWRYQVYVQDPSLAQQDAKPYGALRKWARQFYEVET